ncbi:MAG: hypothetical protein COW40_13815, partial [Cytophagales bacterium CG17_big_fil_post_rev_8_21_14_2_50_40_13]
TITATDANALTYSLGTDNDEALFNIAAGVVTFKSVPDFETRSSYTIQVRANDGLNTASQNVTITITDVDEILPVFTSATSVNFAENGTGTAYTITATDANPITYSLGTGNDEAFFNIAAGIVTFKTAPDFETKNSYTIQVRANDGLNTATQNVTITITDVDEINPVFTSATAVNFAENGTGTAYTITATDANPITYSLGTGNDEALFNIAAGIITFKNAPDFETPKDSNNDNVYMIEVKANDGLNEVIQNVEITVTDTDEIAPRVLFSSGTYFTQLTFGVTLVFSEPVLGFSPSDITSDFAKLNSVEQNGNSYYLRFTATAVGRINIYFKKGGVTDFTGNENQDEQRHVITIADKAAAPTDIILSENELFTNSRVGNLIGELSTVDLSAFDKHTYRIISSDQFSRSLRIFDNKLRSGYLSNYTYSIGDQEISILVTDATGRSFRKNLIIKVIRRPNPIFTFFTVYKGYKSRNDFINFGNIEVGSKESAYLEIKNYGSVDDLIISDILTPSYYTVDQKELVVQPQSSKFVEITFQPLNRGSSKGVVSVISNGKPLNINVSGYGIINTRPIAYASNSSASSSYQTPRRSFDLIGTDRDQQYLRFILTKEPFAGVLGTPQKIIYQLGYNRSSVQYIANTDLSPGLYNEFFEYVAVDLPSGLASVPARVNFTFNLLDSPHSLSKRITQDLKRKDGLKFDLPVYDKRVNAEYTVILDYYSNRFRRYFRLRDEVVKKEDLKDLTSGGFTIASDISGEVFQPISRERGWNPVRVTVTSDNNLRQVGVYQVYMDPNRGGSEAFETEPEDGIVALSGEYSTYENDTVSVDLYALRIGAFDMKKASLEISKGAMFGQIGTPKIIQQSDSVAQWRVLYSGTSEKGVLDSLEFSLIHPNYAQKLKTVAKINVLDVPDAPVIGDLENAETLEDTPIDIVFNINDPDSEVDIRVTSSNPDSVSVSIVNGAIRAIPKFNFYGNVTLKLEAKVDDIPENQTVFKEFGLNVVSVNDRPIMSTINDQQINEDTAFKIRLNATDSDQPSSLFGFNAKLLSTSGATLEVIGDTLFVAPNTNFTGELNIEVTADDALGTSTSISDIEVFKLNVLPINDSPVVDRNFPSQTIVEGLPTIKLDLAQYFSDPETDAKDLIYSVNGASNAQLTVNANVLSITPIVGALGGEFTTVNVSDGEFSTSQELYILSEAVSSDITISGALPELILDEDFGTSNIDLSNIFRSTNGLEANFIYSATGSGFIEGTIEGNRLEISSASNFNGEDQMTIIASLDGKSNFASFKIKVNPINDAPTLESEFDDLQIQEDALFSRTLPSSNIVDVDGDVLTYSVSYAAAWLTFDPATRTFSGTPGNGDVGIVEVTLTATDPSGAAATDVFTIEVVNVNDAPTDISTSSNGFDENLSIGASLITMASIDPDPNNTSFTYSLVSGNGSTDNNAFSIEGDVLIAAQEFDFESKSSYSIRVRTNDGFEGVFEKVLNVTVNNVNEITTDITLSANLIIENSAVGEVISTIASIDPDVNDTHIYSLVAGDGDVDNASFKIVNGALVANEVFDFENRNSYSIRLKTEDAGGLSLEKQFAISVADANDNPTSLTLDNLVIAENESIGATIGNLISTDQDVSDTHTYELIAGVGDADNANFRVEGAVLKTTASFNFENKSSFSLRLKTDDGEGGSFEQQFNISVSNIVETIFVAEGDLSIPDTEIGSSSNITITLKNDGEDELVISQIIYPEGFLGILSSTTIAPLSSQVLLLNFTPIEAKIYSGDINITTNTGPEKISIAATGTIVTSIDNGWFDQTEIIVFPNPASDRLFIDLSDLQGLPAELSITSLKGDSKYLKTNVRERQVAVDVSGYSEGVYIVTLRTEQGVKTKKIIIKR